MKRAVFVSLVLVFIGISDASAWCVKCENFSCWMTSNSGSVRCEPVQGAGCAAWGVCSDGTTGCPEGPDGCSDDKDIRSALLRPSCDAQLASAWRLESVVISHSRPSTLVTASSQPVQMAYVATTH